MSVLDIGKGQLSDEAINFRNKVASQDAKIATQQSQLIKQASEIQELSSTIKETLTKLSQETQRNISLEKDANRYSSELEREKTARSNLEATLNIANEKVKAKDSEIKGLESTLNSLSLNSRTVDNEKTSLLHDLNVANTRIKELQADIRTRDSSSPVSAASNRTTSRPRSSSLSNFRISSLERDLDEAKNVITKLESDLRMSAHKLAKAVNDSARADNERVATEKRLDARLQELNSALEDKEEELQYLRQQQCDSDREEELLRRIDEDDAKISSLESLLRSEDPRQMKRDLVSLQDRLRVGQERVAESDYINTELVREKEEALEGLQEARDRIAQLETLVKSVASSQHHPDEATTRSIERLLLAVDRLRGERDDLRRNVEFLEQESRFAVEALEAQLAESAEMKTKIDLAAMPDSSQKEQIRRLGLIATGSAVVIETLRSQLSSTEDQLRQINVAGDGVKTELECKRKEILELMSTVEQLEVQLDETSERPNALDPLSEELASRLESKDAERREAEGKCQNLEQQLGEASKVLANVETSRDSLLLQVTHLERDLASVQQELNDAESRYSSLQFHQLSTMSANQVVETLKEQIQELEMRVIRRTEQIGLHQHDIGRLETNLRVAEERVAEMTAELEMISTQKDAMVEDCADARDARDAAVSRSEQLEEDIEALESELFRGDAALKTVVNLLVQSTHCSRIAVADKLHMKCLVSKMTGEHEHFLKSLESKEEDSKHLRTDIQRLKVEAQQGTVALALSAISLRDYRIHTRDMLGRDNPSAEQLLVLETELSKARRALDEMQESYSNLKSSHDTLVDHSREAEESQSAASCALRQEWNAEVSNLKSELEAALLDAKKTHQSLDDVTSSYDSLHRETHDKEKEFSYRISELKNTTIDLEARIEAESANLAAQEDETGRLKERHRIEMEAQAHSEEAQRTKFLSAKERADNTEFELSKLETELSSTRDQVVKLTEDLQDLKSRELDQKREITTLVADVQRSNGRAKWLEVQIKDNEQSSASLVKQLDQVRADLAEAQAGRSRAEGTVSLQEVHHKRELDQLQRQIEQLRSRPNLDATVKSLEERNTEMEELLRQKSSEVEDNDDRVFEKIKENKKLAAKVESLTRKVNILQSKLAAAKASSPKSSDGNSPPLPHSAQRPRATTLAGVPALPTVPPVPPLPETTTPILRATSLRSVSGPSSLPRPKTPERRTVLRTRSPEKDKTPDRKLSFNPSPSTTTIGKKRPAPDDFESLPPQGFTPESKPCEPQENLTPRVRKVLTSIQSGFTPVRNQTRPSKGFPSPKREALSTRSNFTEMSSTPSFYPPPDTTSQSEKPSKRSWLGKIRAGSVQVTPAQMGQSRTAYPFTN